jgi:hypothetical protein
MKIYLTLSDIIGIALTVVMLLSIGFVVLKEKLKHIKELIWLYGQVIFKIALPVSMIFYIIYLVTK